MYQVHMQLLNNNLSEIIYCLSMFNGQFLVQPIPEFSPKRVLYREVQHYSDGGPFFFHVVLIATRISKSFNVVFKHRSDQFHLGEPCNTVPSIFCT